MRRFTCCRCHAKSGAHQTLLGGYIAPVSGHSRAATVDLTLLHCPGEGATGCTPLDMGTPFDWFGTRANTDSTLATDTQRANRPPAVFVYQRRGNDVAGEWRQHGAARGRRRQLHGTTA